MANMKKIEKIFDDNGQIYREKVSPVYSYWSDDKGYKLSPNRSSIRRLKGVPYPRSVTKVDKLYFMILSDYLLGDSNMIGYRGNNNDYKPMDVDQMAELLEVSRRTAYLFLNKSKKNGMIAESKIEVGRKIETQYYMNPIFFSAVRNVSLHLYLLFKEQLDPVLPDWVQIKYNDMMMREEG